MVSRFFAVLVFILSAASCMADSQCTNGGEFEPPLCPSPYANVTTVVVAENGAVRASAPEESAECKSFVLTESDVKAYFANARVTNESDVHHTLDWSPCYAGGQVVFADGQKARWSINRFRVGELELGSDKKVVLYCPDCEFPVFQ